MKYRRKGSCCLCLFVVENPKNFQIENCWQVTERLATAGEGYELLEQKRKILVIELTRKLEQVKMLERGTGCLD